MPRYHRRRHNPFGRRSSSAPVTQAQSVARKRGKCASCHGYFEKGDAIAVLKLKKRYRVLLCGHTLKGSKKFHPACVPPDIIAAMGYDPTKAGAYVPPVTQAAPPPKPLGYEELTLAALLGVENALKARAKELKRFDPPAYVELAAMFKTFQGIKARALRPGTEHEGNTAMKLALRKALDVLF